MGERWTWARIGWIWLVALVVIGMLPSNAGAKGWSVLRTPNPQQAQGTFVGVSCSSATSCTAVGTGHQATLAERWNGTRWVIEPTPNPVPNSSSFQAVSCTSTSSCMAVGIASRATMAERWNGKTWTVVPTPKPSGSQISELNAVSCTSPSACTAVGLSSPNTFQTPQIPLAERWNGTSWAIQTTPSLGGAQQLSKFLGVACSSASSCTAVGTTAKNSSSHGVPLAERWNGTSWAVQATPVPSGAIFSELNGVSCSAASACTAVGDLTNSSFTGAALAERWNGTSWAIQTTPHVTGALLHAVSCRAASSCTAVGDTFTSGNGVLLAERWNGSSWAVEATPKPSGSPTGALIGVSCTSPSACTAAGAAQRGRGSESVSLAERWNGKAWAIESTPNPLATLSSDLFGVSCTSANACTAVGSGKSTTLAERWNGKSWAIEATPNPSGARSSVLSAVSCTSPSACIAVGAFVTIGGAGKPLAERWNGKTWAIQTTPTPTGGKNNSLNAVSCTSANACTAVGNFTNGGGAVVPLAERWNGSTWVVQATPSLGGATLSLLLGVSCSASACTAVGSTGASATSSVTLAELWNGTSWAIQSTPNPSSAENGSELKAVSCTSASACTAVGDSTDGSFNTTAFAERWDGTSWALQSTATPGTFSTLIGVSCTSTSDCIAVGASFNGASAQSTLGEHWNGSSWALQSTPNLSGASSSALLGVSCTAANACMAAGSGTHPNNIDTTLAERFTG